VSGAGHLEPLLVGSFRRPAHGFQRAGAFRRRVPSCSSMAIRSALLRRMRLRAASTGPGQGSRIPVGRNGRTPSRSSAGVDPGSSLLHHPWCRHRSPGGCLRSIEKTTLCTSCEWQYRAEGIYFGCHDVQIRSGDSPNEQDSRVLADRVGPMWNVLCNSEELAARQFGDSDTRGRDPCRR
jgi:hypothetical protein